MSVFVAQLHHGPIDVDSRDQEPGIFDPYFGYRLRGASVSTTMAGMGVLSGLYACDTVSARQMLRRLGHHVTAYSYGRLVHEGRLEQVALAGGGVQITSVGYYNSLDDLPFNRKFEDGIDAATLATKILKKRAPLLASKGHFVKITGTKLALESYDGGETAKQVLESSLSTSEDIEPIPHYAMVVAGRRFRLVAQETRYISYTIPVTSLGGPVQFGRDLLELYTGIDVIYEVEVTSGSGATASTTTERRVYEGPDDPDIVRTLGFRRRLSVSGSQAVDSEDNAKLLAKSTLRQYRTGVSEFSLELAAPVLDCRGGPLRPQHMLAGGLVRLDQGLGDLGVLDDKYHLALVTGVTWNVDEMRVTVQCEKFDGTLTGEQKPFGTSGLRRKVG